MKPACRAIVAVTLAATVVSFNTSYAHADVPAPSTVDSEDPPPHRVLQPFVPQPPPVAPVAETGFEGGLGIFQGFMAAVIPIAALAAAANNDSSGPLFWTPLALSPVASGLVVCSVGNLSDRYEGPCLPAVVGAFVGVAASIPLALWDAFASRNDHSEFLPPGAFGFAVGWFALQPLAAIVGWHSWKRPRHALSPAAPPAPRTFNDEPISASQRATAVPGQFVVRLVSVSF